MANDKEHGYNKGQLKVKKDVVLSVTGQTINGDSVELAVEITDYDPPRKKIKDIKVYVPITLFMGNSEADMINGLDVILEREARRLIAVDRVNGLTGHQKRWQARE